jgi:integrase
MQRGHITKHRGNWCLRYYEWVLRDGAKVRKKSFHRLAPVSKDYPNKRSVLLLAEKVLAPHNTGNVQAASSMTVAEFIENVFLAHAKKNLRPSTVKHYEKDIYLRHVKSRLGKIRLRDFRTVTGQRLIASIDAGRRTQVHAKVFLSSVFKHAKREGILDGESPMRDVSVPGRPVKKKAAVYTMTEIDLMLQAVGTEGIAGLVIGTAAFTGLRLSELRGLRWQDYDGEYLSVQRAVWRTQVTGTKTAESEGRVPVLPLLKTALDEQRAKTNGQPDEYIFQGGKTSLRNDTKARLHPSLNLPNLVRRVILPAFAEYAEKEQISIEWRGWHAFRRGLATNLYSLGVAPKVIQAILRHSDIGTTLAYYVGVPDSESKEAMQRIEDWFKVV